MEVPVLITPSPLGEPTEGILGIWISNLRTWDLPHVLASTKLDVQCVM